MAQADEAAIQRNIDLATDSLKVLTEQLISSGRSLSQVWGEFLDSGNSIPYMAFRAAKRGRPLTDEDRVKDLCQATRYCAPPVKSGIPAEDELSSMVMAVQNLACMLLNPNAKDPRRPLSTAFKRELKAVNPRPSEGVPAEDTVEPADDQLGPVEAAQAAEWALLVANLEQECRARGAASEAALAYLRGDATRQAVSELFGVSPGVLRHAEQWVGSRLEQLRAT